MSDFIDQEQSSWRKMGSSFRRNLAATIWVFRCRLVCWGTNVWIWCIMCFGVCVLNAVDVVRWMRCNTMLEFVCLSAMTVIWVMCSWFYADVLAKCGPFPSMHKLCVQSHTDTRAHMKDLTTSAGCLWRSEVMRRITWHYLVERNSFRTVSDRNVCALIVEESFCWFSSYFR